MKVKDPTQTAAQAPPPAAPVAQPQPAPQPQPQPQPVVEQPKAAPPPPPPPPPPPKPETSAAPRPVTTTAVIPAATNGGAMSTAIRPADLPDFLGDVVHVGEGVTPGFENVGASGLGLPMLFVAQPQTPEVLQGKLKAGDIYLSTDPEKALVPLGKEFDFSIPFHYREWLEWADRASGLGILNRSKDPRSDLAKKAAISFANRGSKKEERVIGDKTVKVDVFENHVFLICGEGERELNAMPLSRTAYKKGNLLINLAKKRVGCPIWTGKYTARIVMETNAKGSWFNWDFKTSGWISRDDKEFVEKMFNDCRAMYENIQLAFTVDQAGAPDVAEGGAGAPAGGADF